MPLGEQRTAHGLNEAVQTYASAYPGRGGARTRTRRLRSFLLCTRRPRRSENQGVHEYIAAHTAGNLCWLKTGLGELTEESEDS
jgi:hypothetical protein